MEKDIKNRFTTFIKAEKLGVCSHCNKEVFSDTLYTDTDIGLYHYSCYNFYIHLTEGDSK